MTQNEAIRNVAKARKEALDAAHQVVAEYFLDQVAIGDERPVEVVRGLLRVKWPDREFDLTDASDPWELVDLHDFADVKTGESALSLYHERRAVAASPG